MNDLFVCSCCQHLDQLEFAYPQGLPAGDFKCTQCQTGQWHGLISRRVYDPTTDLVVNAPTGLGLS